MNICQLKSFNPHKLCTISLISIVQRNMTRLSSLLLSFALAMEPLAAKCLNLLINNRAQYISLYIDNVLLYNKTRNVHSNSELMRIILKLIGFTINMDRILLTDYLRIFIYLFFIII